MQSDGLGVRCGATSTESYAPPQLVHSDDTGLLEKKASELSCIFAFISVEKFKLRKAEPHVSKIPSQFNSTAVYESYVSYVFCPARSPPPGSGSGATGSCSCGREVKQ